VVHPHCRGSVRRQVDDERAIISVLCGCRRYRRRESEPEDSERYRERPQRSCCTTVGYNCVEIFDTPGGRNPSRDYRRRYRRSDVYIG
jgi:hypothetical protein